MIRPGNGPAGDPTGGVSRKATSEPPAEFYGPQANQRVENVVLIDEMAPGTEVA